jgi:hypothetical protein
VTPFFISIRAASADNPSRDELKRRYSTTNAAGTFSKVNPRKRMRGRAPFYKFPSIPLTLPFVVVLQ